MPQPPPAPPEKPEPEMCCNRGCCPCIFDYYWDALDRWAEPRRLAACVEFIVFTRGEKLKPREGHVFHALEEGHPASATTIREAFARGQTEHHWLTPAVSQWIRGHRLYQPAQ